jgi:hypothetical protein
MDTEFPESPLHFLHLPGYGYGSLSWALFSCSICASLNVFLGVFMPLSYVTSV